MQSGVTLICFAASYGIALGLECLGVWTRLRLHRAALAAATGAGLVAHTLYLADRVAELPAAPLGSQQDWFIASAWVLALAYLAIVVSYRRATLGLFFLPIVLGLLAASHWASDAPITSFEAPRFWAQVHGASLMLGSVLVLIGFVAGLAYLVQSTRLKQKLPPSRRLPLPSLEWLQRVNNFSLPAATFFVGVGFVTGVLNRVATAGTGSVPWQDPVVISLGAMLVWLLATEVFRLVYPPAREGRKVAYLTVSSFVFLVLVLVSFSRPGSLHTPAQGQATTPAEVTAPGGAS